MQYCPTQGKETGCWAGGIGNAGQGEVSQFFYSFPLYPEIWCEAEDNCSNGEREIGIFQGPDKVWTQETER